MRSGMASNSGLTPDSDPTPQDSPAWNFYVAIPAAVLFEHESNLGSVIPAAMHATIAWLQGCLKVFQPSFSKGVVILILKLF